MDTENTSEKYFDELLSRIRDIRSSERSAQAKIAEVMATTIDYSVGTAYGWLQNLYLTIGREALAERLANYIVLEAEGRAMGHVPMTMKDFGECVDRILDNRTMEQKIYQNPSYQGVPLYAKEDDEHYACLPEELKGFKGLSMILKVEDMERMMDTFCSVNTHYRRAYAILADLDKQVMECMESGKFPLWIDIPYKEDGDALFEFSHFELDLSEPDPRYRTLYVVYRYDNTAS